MKSVRHFSQQIASQNTITNTQVQTMQSTTSYNIQFSLQSFHHLARDPTPSPNPRSIKHKNPRNNRERDTDPPQQASSPLKRQRAENGIREERRRGRATAAAERLGRDGRAGIAAVGVGEVVEHGEIDGEDAEGDAADGEGWDDPVDRGKLGPAEPEEPDGEERALEACGVETAFWAFCR